MKTRQKTNIWQYFMGIIYKAQRVGKNGKVFTLYKFRTLLEGSQEFAYKQGYTRFGRFLRKTHLDELPQLLNVLKGDIKFFGPRPEEQSLIDIIPKQMKDVVLSVKPGIVDLASLLFFNEEKIISEFQDPNKAYWEIIRPLKFTLQAFYIENKSFLFNLAILWGVFKKSISSLWKD